MRILFLYNRPQQTSKTADAYNTRMDGLRRGLKCIGVPTDVVSLRTLRFNRPHLAFALNARTIASQAQGYEIIHAGGAAATVAAAAARSRPSHLVVFDAHGDEVLETKLEWQASPTPRRAYLVLQAMFLTSLALRMADVLVAISEPFRQHYLAKGVPAARIVVARNGVDTSVFTRMLPRSNGHISICYAGGFQSWQAINTLIEAFAQTDDQRLNLHLIGFSPQDQSLKSMISARFAGRATLEDWMPVSDLIERLGEADILIIPRTTHQAMRGGLPSKFAEYLAIGRPVIVTNTDETATFVRQFQCGLISEPTADGLAKAIRQAAALSEEERHIMGARSRRLAETLFDWRIIAQDYVAALRNVVKARGTHHG